MTAALFTAWRVALTVQTALHIGDGTRLREGVDYILEPFGDATQARVIDIDRALALMTEHEIAAARQGMIARALGEARREQATIAVLPLYQFRKDAKPGEVLALIRDADGRPYIPGSSLKGAIRTALLRRLSPEQQAAELAWAAARSTRGGLLEEKVFRVAALSGREATGANRDLLRVLRMSDFHPLPNRPPAVAFVETQVRRVDSPRKPVLSVWVEAVLRGAGFLGTIALDHDLLRQFQTADTVRDLFRRLPEVLREDGQATLQAEQAWADGPFAPWAKLQAQSAFIALGWGTGWLAHTIGPLIPLEQRRLLANRLQLGRGGAPANAPFPRSYKVARVRINDHFSEAPLGLVTLQFQPLAGEPRHDRARSS
jgi:CRISPR-associated protein Csm5